MSPGDFAAFALIAVSGISVLSIVGAVARRISPRSRGFGTVIGAQVGGEAQQSVAELRDEVESLRSELAAMQARLGELDDLHNRVDFAERMIAQQKARDALPGPR